MTFSVLAIDPDTGTFGGAAATGNLAVGAWVLRATPGVGAVATQGMAVSTLWGDQALAMLAEGYDAPHTLDALTRRDTGAAHRQLSVLDLTGRGAAWTGSENTDAKGHRIRENTVFAGNWLSGLSVIDAMEAAYFSQPAGTDIGLRMLAALDAARAAGSDSRGTFSAAIRLVGRDHAPLDLRVDYDEADPLGHLRKLYDMATHPPYSDWSRQVPTLADPYRC